MQAIASVIGDAGRLRAMSAKALRVVSEHLDWDRLFQRALRFNNPSSAHL